MLHYKTHATHQGFSRYQGKVYFLYLIGHLTTDFVISRTQKTCLNIQHTASKALKANQYHTGLKINTVYILLQFIFRFCMRYMHMATKTK